MPAALSATPSLRWDVFCRVIDNFGDIGVCWRLSRALAQRGHRVRLRVDDASALDWMAPHGAQGVQVHPYDAPWEDDAPPQVVLETFGCEAPAAYLEALARQPVPLVNVEYLSAQAYVERCHRLPSPILHGPGQGLTRWFFYPGFTPATGGLLREDDLLQRQTDFARQFWRTRHGVAEGDLAISLFCYEPAALPQWLEQLAAWPGTEDVRLLVTPGRAAQAVRGALENSSQNGLDALLNKRNKLSISYLEARSQMEFDELLWACDLNMVRGEDSLVRALWAGQPLVWHIYPQEDDAHRAKLQAFLDWLQAPVSLRDFHWAWNGVTDPRSLPQLTPDLLAQWRPCVRAARQRLLEQNSLIDQLQTFVFEKS